MCCYLVDPLVWFCSCECRVVHAATVAICDGFPAAWITEDSMMLSLGRIRGSDFLLQCFRESDLLG